MSALLIIGGGMSSPLDSNSAVKEYWETEAQLRRIADEMGMTVLQVTT